MRVLTEYAAELGRGARARPGDVARKLSAVRVAARAPRSAPSRVPDAALAPKRAAPPAVGAEDRPRSTRCSRGCAGTAPLGLRNRALVELIYSAGLRSAEAVGLDLQDVDFEQELVHVRGKGGKERTVPLGEEAAYRLSAYLREGRPQLARGRGERRCSSLRAAGGSTRARSAGSSRTRTASATPSPRTCSRAAPTCA